MEPLSEPRETWTLPRRIAFRFWFALALLALLPFPLGQLPWTDRPAILWHGAVNALVPWVGRQVLRIAGPIESHGTGSGDRTWDYVQWFSFVAIAAMVAAVWSAVDRRTAYPRLNRALRVYVRYALCLRILPYGLGKIVPMQFGHPGRQLLQASFGEISPMRLLWTFMGVSPAYAAFAGAAETVGGLLLLFRRTTTLGALILAGVMSNVVMMNFCYDVPVKLWSSFLLLLAFWLASADATRLARFFVLNRPAEPADLAWPRATGRLRFAWWAAKLALIAALVTPIVQYMAQISKRPVEIDEIYRTEGSPPGPWAAAELTGHAIAIRRPDGSKLRLRADWNRKVEVLILTDRLADGTEKTWVLNAVVAPDGALELKGNVMDEAVKVRLRRFDAPPIPLLARGFHWVNEFPRNW